MSANPDGCASGISISFDDSGVDLFDDLSESQSGRMSLDVSLPNENNGSNPSFASFSVDYATTDLFDDLSEPPSPIRPHFINFGVAMNESQQSSHGIPGDVDMSIVDDENVGGIPQENLHLWMGVQVKMIN
jgi:hypothetical protein